LHVHVLGSEGEAKFWLEPRIELPQNHGLSQRQLKVALRLIEEHEGEIRSDWSKHFPG